MNPLYHDAIARRLTLPLHEGPDKTTTLAEAVRRHVHAGDAVRTVVSDRGVYEKASEHGELRLSGLFGEAPEADLVRAARESCGWELQVAPALRRFAAPTADELALIRLFDPRRYFLGA